MMGLSPRQTRVVGLLLIAYGLVGMAVIVGALAIGSPAISRIDDLMTSAVSTTSSAARAATAAADAMGGFGQSMEQARRSVTDAAGVSRDAAATSSDLADAMSVSIFGAQPLIGLAADFNETSVQLRGLALNLDDVGVALAASGDDLSRVERTLRSLATDLTVLRERIGARSDDPTLALNLFLYAFLAWQALPALASLAIGSVLLRRSRMAPA